MEELGSKWVAAKSDKNFIGKLFQKKFHYELDEANNQNFSLKDRREQLIKMYEASEERPQSFKSALLLEILENGLKLDIYDKKYFLAYLEHPLKRWHINKTKVSNDWQDYTWNAYLKPVQQRQDGVMSSTLEGKLYKKYLEQFYKEKHHLKDFEDYFTSKFLSTLVEEFDFLAGKKMKNDKIDFEKFDKLASHVIIELLSWNKKVFKPEEKVKIIAELKNVPKMHIKIFEFNSLNYYKKNCAPFKTDVNLDGLIASYEKNLEFDKVSAHVKFRHNFEFPELDQKIGLFVIEFISNGYSSRAIIKKGTLSIIYKQTITGQIAYILDDNREICWGEDTGIYYRNQFFKAKEEKGGQIIIPYEKYQSIGNAILVHDNFAQLVEFTRYAENYSLDVAYIINPESLLMGNQATIILKPTLKVNNRKWSRASLSKIKAVITTISFVDKIPLSRTFDDLCLKDDRDLELTFNIPPNLESVHVIFEAQIYNISQQKTDILSSSHLVKLKTNNNTLTFYESHLRKIKGEYIFMVLDKNGMPIPNVDVVFDFQHYLYIPPNKHPTLTTDDKGCIQLGALSGVKSFQTHIYSTSNDHTNFWEVNPFDQHYTFPDSIQILEDEEIEIPFITALKDSKFSQDTFSLIRMNSQDGHISNEFEKAKLIPTKEADSPNIVKIWGLKQGFYKISFKETKRSIKVIVHEGTYWKDKSFILKKDTLSEFRSNKKIAYVRTKKIKHNKKDNKDEFVLKVCNFGKNTRVHIMTTNFVSYKDLTSFYDVKSKLDNSITSEIFKLSQWNNAYLSNRKLGDEFRYVFERKYIKSFPGNSLIRPQILLKRMKIRETTFDEEQIGLGDQYESMQVQMMNTPYANMFAERSVWASPRLMPQSNMLPTRMRMPPHLGSKKLRMSRAKEYEEEPDVIDPSRDQYKSFLNFLKNSGIVKANLIPDKKGNVSFSVPSEKYALLNVLVIDNENVVHASINLPDPKSEVAKRNLALVKPLDPKKHYNETRIVINLFEGDKHKIKNMTSAHYNVVDSIEKVKNIQLEISKMDHCYILPDLLFLTSWNKLGFEEQLKKYASSISHETHLFLYFKDRPFFDRVIKPFLMNKYERSFIDYWLLEDFERIERYSKVEFFDLLNSVEKVLLIHSVRQNGIETGKFNSIHNNDIARVLADRIMINAESIQANMEYRDLWFDVVINASYEDTDKDRDAEIMSDNEEEKRMPESLNLNQGPSSYFNNLSAFNMPVYSMATKGMTAGRGRGGAKTRQTARMSTGGKYPTKRLAGYLHRNNESKLKTVYNFYRFCVRFRRWSRRWSFRGRFWRKKTNKNRISKDG